MKKEIDNLRKKLFELIREATPPNARGMDISYYISRAKDIEYKLQALQGYEQCDSYHVFPKVLHFRTMWYGRTFCCKETGVMVTLDENVYPKQFIRIGEGFLDLGDGSYSRFCGIYEIHEG